MRKLPWLVVMTSSAYAAPKPPLCVPGDTSAMSMFGSGGKAIACWEATGDCMSIDDNKEIVAVLKRRFPEIDGPHKEDICYATTNRQLAVKKVAPKVDAMIVVGSPNSSN